MSRFRVFPPDLWACFGRRGCHPAASNRNTGPMEDQDHWIICANISRYRILLESTGRLDDAQRTTVTRLLSEADTRTYVGPPRHLVARISWAERLGLGSVEDHSPFGERDFAGRWSRLLSPQASTGGKSG